MRHTNGFLKKKNNNSYIPETNINEKTNTKKILTNYQIQKPIA